MEKNVYSPQVTKLTSPLHFLTEQQKIFVNAIVRGKAPNVAARMAGYASPDQQGYSVVKSPKVQEAIRYLHRRHEKAADMTRKKVMDGLLEAIEMAKVQADSGNMISGWREIAKMCGYYAPEVKKIDINVTAKRVIDKLETLSDADLLEMVEQQGRIIEHEAVEILNDLQNSSNSEET